MFSKLSVSDSFYKTVEELCKDLYVKALKDLPPDVRKAIKEASESEKTETGKQVLATMLENIGIADGKDRLVCQDTGIPIYFVKVGNKLSIDFVLLEEAIIRGCQRATVEHPLRSSVVSPFKRENNQNSSGYRIPSIHYDVVQDNDKLEILMVPKGSGSENMSFLKMLIPAEGVRGVKRFILETVANNIGANPCPPFILPPLLIAYLVFAVGGYSSLCPPRRPALYIYGYRILRNMGIGMFHINCYGSIYTPKAHWADAQLVNCPKQFRLKGRHFRIRIA